MTNQRRIKHVFAEVLCVSETNKWQTVFFFLLKAIRAAIDSYLKQAPINKPGSIVGDYEFKKANDTLNAVCKNLMKGGKVRPVLHKTPITSEQLQKLYESGQLGNADTKDPKQLQQTAWLYTYLYFGRRGRESHSAKHLRVM